MVIFHSYVSLPEGTIAHRDHWQSLNTEGFFFDLSKPISLMKKTNIKNERVICPDMSCRRRKITIEPQGWHSNTLRGSRKQTWEIVKAGGEWPVGWEKIGDSNPKVLLPISSQQLLPRSLRLARYVARCHAAVYSAYPQRQWNPKDNL